MGDPASLDNVESNWERHPASTLGQHTHLNIHKHMCTHTHTPLNLFILSTWNFRMFLFVNWRRISFCYRWRTAWQEAVLHFSAQTEGSWSGYAVISQTLNTRREAATAMHCPDAQVFDFRKGFTGLAVRRVGLTALGHGSFQTLTFHPYRAMLLPYPSSAEWLTG